MNLDKCNKVLRHQTVFKSSGNRRNYNGTVLILCYSFSHYMACTICKILKQLTRHTENIIEEYLLMYRMLSFLK